SRSHSELTRGFQQLHPCLPAKICTAPQSSILFRSPNLRHHSCWLHLHRRPIRQHLRHTLHHFSRVVPHPNHSVRSPLDRVLHHQLQRFFPRLLAHILKQSNIP